MRTESNDNSWCLAPSLCLINMCFCLLSLLHKSLISGSSPFSSVVQSHDSGDLDLSNCSLFSIHYSLTISVFPNHLHPIKLIDLLRKRNFLKKEVWRTLYPKVSSEIDNVHTQKIFVIKKPV